MKKEFTNNIVIKTPDIVTYLNKTKDVIVYNEWYEEDPDELEYSDEPKYTNGLEDFVRIVEFICDANGIWYPNPGEVRIICAII